MSVLENLFTDIADAIRDKTGETDTIKPIDFPEKIAGIKENSIELLENILIQPDFSNGDQSFSAPDEMAVKSAIIQKPETLIPENIAEGVNIAGILGTLASGEGGGNVKYFFTSISPTTTTDIIVNHGLGATPDVVIVLLDSTVVTNGYAQLYFGISSALYQKLGSTAKNIQNIALGLKFNNFYRVIGATPIDSTSSASIYNADTNSVTIGSSSLPLMKSNIHRIIAISGLA